MYINKKLFSKEVILLHQNVKDKEEALTILATELERKNVVNTNFLPAILKREQEYPTGLALQENLGVAIPHTDPDEIKQEQLGFISLQHPIEFKQMGDANSKVKVSMIFVLCLKSPDKQLNMLKSFMNMFTDAETMKQINAVETKEQFLKAIE